jgi:hypothetical protein
MISEHSKWMQEHTQKTMSKWKFLDYILIDSADGIHLNWYSTDDDVFLDEFCSFQIAKSSYG